MREDTKTMSTGLQTETQNVHRPMEGVAVIGEAVRGVAPESAEFLIEITTSSPTAAQALRDNHVKTTQIAQAIGALGVQQADLQTISLNVYNLYSQTLQGFAGIGGMAQIGQGGFGMLAPDRGCTAGYSIRLVLREKNSARDRCGNQAASARLWTLPREPERPSREHSATAYPTSRPPVETALEAAGKDARAGAESLATAAGKQLGDPVAISEEIIASNGTYAALRAAAPFAFGAGAPQVTGDLEYYARVSARFRFQ